MPPVQSRLPFSSRRNASAANLKLLMVVLPRGAHFQTKSASQVLLLPVKAVFTSVPAKSVSVLLRSAARVDR